MAAVVGALAGGPVVAAGTWPARESQQPDVVVILTDDQRWDTVWAMPAVRRLVRNAGVAYKNAFVPTALCCPSRASLLSGRYAHNTNVWTNQFALFDDSDTLATRLDASGYRTGYFGKYLNNYDGSTIPPGWDRWFAFADTGSGGGYYDYDLSDDGSLVHYGSSPSEYSTDVVAAEAEAFIRDTLPGEPLFAVVAPYAPHWPATPAPRHAAAFADLAPWRPPSFNEADVSDKPRWVRRLNKVDARELDAFRQRQHETLLAVDEMVAALVGTLEDMGRLESAVVVYTSDNAMQWGEHRLRNKHTPYEAAGHVPLLARWTGVLPAGARDGRVVAANVDLAATILTAAAAGTSDIDGVAVTDAARFAMPVEAGSSRPLTRPAYCGARSAGALYVRYSTGEQEFYRRSSDPWELRNAERSRSPLMLRLRRVSRRLCGGLVPGM